MVRGMPADESSFTNSRFNSKDWLTAIDTSSFGPEEWEGTARALLAKLENDKLHAPFDEITEYLSCCAQSVVSTYPLPRLEEIALEFYDRHGMEKATVREE